MFARDAALTAVILGLFSIAWFSSAGDLPRGIGIIGAALGLLAAIAGGILARQHWATPSALDEPGAMRSYNLIAGIEFGSLAVGSVALGVLGQPAYIAPWACGIVGLHFWPLASVLSDPALKLLGGLMVGVAVTAVVVGVLTTVTPNAIAGTGVGVLFLGYAGRALVIARG